MQLLVPAYLSPYGLSSYGLNRLPRPWHNHFCQHFCAGVLFPFTGRKKGKATLQFFTEPLAMSS